MLVRCASLIGWFRRSTLGISAFAALILLLLAEVASAQTVVFAPHPDDEALFASGIIYRAHQAGQNVKVVIATNGDCEDGDARARQLETVAGMAQLGVPENDIIFLGYPDCGLREIYYNYTTPESQYTSQAGRNTTYGFSGLGHTDYHTYFYGVPARYSGYSITQDIQTVLRNYRPQEIYTTSAYDENLDHQALNFLVSEALVPMIRADVTYQPTVHDAIVHEPCELSCNPNYQWPMPAFTPTVNMPIIPFLDQTPLSWGNIESVEVPLALQAPTRETNLKSLAITAYETQGGSSDWLQSFVKRNEVFWKWDLWANLALRATATASSNLTAGTTPSRVNDGMVAGSPRVPTSRGGKGEWVANDTAGAWVLLTWPSGQQVTRIILHDRPEPGENITAGVLNFSDGSSIVLPALPAGGVGYEVAFATKTVSWVRFTVTTAAGSAAGLAEMEVYGPPAVKTTWQLPGANVSPSIVSGPSAFPSNITDSGVSTITVNATDPNGDALVYSWTTTGGSITGTGASVTYVPPVVTSAMAHTITVIVADGRGGVVSNSVQVMVTPANAPHNIALTATATASSYTVAHGQSPDKVTDGIISGYPTDAQREWATQGELIGAWIQLTWASPQAVCGTVLHDRINLTDQILAGTLHFSDGSSIAVGTLPNDGTGLTVNFGARIVTWMRFEVTNAAGGSAGLAEWEVLPAPGVCSNPATDVRLAPQSLSLRASRTASRSTVLQVLNLGFGTVTWTASANVPWITVTPASGQSSAGAPGLITITVPPTTVPGRSTGTITITSTSAALTMTLNASVSLVSSQAASDYDGDGRAEIGVYRPSNGTWFMRYSSNGYSMGSYASYQWGLSGDVPLQADFDGDGKGDLAVYRPSSAEWFVRYSSHGFSLASSATYQWGLAGDVPLPADFDGDGRTDLAVYRPSNGNWYIRYSSNNYGYSNWTAYQWGASGDKPIVADFDGDGKTDLVIYRPSSGEWWIRFSSAGYSLQSAASYQWGFSGDLPIAGDFDGDGRTDLAIYRPDNGTWYIRFSTSGYSLANWMWFNWGMPGDSPFAADFDGDGKADLNVYRPSTGEWFTRYSANGGYGVTTWGLNGDMPLVQK